VCLSSTVVDRRRSRGAGGAKTRPVTRAADLRRTAAALAAAQDGVVSRAQLRRLGIDRNRVAREVAAGRWLLHGRSTIGVHTGPLGVRAAWWRAVWEVGRGAALDGSTALAAAGLVGYADPHVHVSVPHDAVPVGVDGVRVHRVRDWSPAEVVGVGVPRVRPHLAAVRAAQWALSDRQAALVLCMAVQQRLVPAGGFCPVRAPGAHYGRTAFVRQVLADIGDGAHSLGELDFARLCRIRGLPAPSRQVVRQGPRGRIYLDVRWDCGLCVEVDGAQHRLGLAVMQDNLRRNDLLLRGDVTLTVDLVGLRLDPDGFLDQVERGLRRLGAIPPGISSADAPNAGVRRTATTSCSGRTRTRR
jgi:hypothetical protein